MEFQLQKNFLLKANQGFQFKRLANFEHQMGLIDLTILTKV